MQMILVLQPRQKMPFATNLSEELVQYAAQEFTDNIYFFVYFTPVRKV